MLVANESNWRTDDLEALVEAVLAMPTYIKGYRVHDSTLLLFRTSVSKEPPSAPYGVVMPIRAAHWRRSSKRWSDTVLVNIRSRNKLKQPVLDRLAQIRDGYEQDMASVDVEEVARAIGHAIGSWNMEKDDYSWARKKSLRARPRSERSSVALEREIWALQEKQDKTQTTANRKIRLLQDKIDGLKSKF